MSLSQNLLNEKEEFEGRNDYSMRKIVYFIVMIVITILIQLCKVFVNVMVEVLKKYRNESTTILVNYSINFVNCFSIYP